MQRKIKPLIFGILICSGIFMSFQISDQDPVIHQIMEQEIEKRLASFRKERMKICRERIMETANRRADSIIIAKSRYLKILQDSLGRPLAPGRPIPPKLLEPIDSTLPAPLLGGELLDTLNEE